MAKFNWFERQWIKLYCKINYIINLPLRWETEEFEKEAKRQTKEFRKQNKLLFHPICMTPEEAIEKIAQGREIFFKDPLSGKVSRIVRQNDKAKVSVCDSLNSENK